MACAKYIKRSFAKIAKLLNITKLGYAVCNFVLYSLVSIRTMRIMLIIRIADSTKRAMADFAIAAEFTLFAQEEFADAFIASAEKVLVIHANFFT